LARLCLAAQRRPRRRSANSWNGFIRPRPAPVTAMRCRR